MATKMILLLTKKVYLHFYNVVNKHFQWTAEVIYWTDSQTFGKYVSFTRTM